MSAKKIDNRAMAFISQGAQEVAPEPQQTPATQEPQEAQKAPRERMSLIFRPGNLGYLQLISRIDGTSITGYLNSLIEKDQQERAGEVEQAKQLLKGGGQ